MTLILLRVLIVLLCGCGAALEFFCALPAQRRWAVWSRLGRAFHSSKPSASAEAEVRPLAQIGQIEAKEFGRV